MDKLPSNQAAEPLTDEEIGEVVSWVKTLDPKDQRSLHDMAKMNTSPSGIRRGAFWAGKNRGQFG